MKQVIKWIAFVFAISGIILLFFICFNKTYYNTSFKIDPALASNFGSFFGGLVGTIFSVASVALLIYTILHQKEESAKADVRNNFFKMVDYHYEHVNNMKVPHITKQKAQAGRMYEARKSFVSFKIQIKRLLIIISEINVENNLSLSPKSIIDIAYSLFFYGLTDSWRPFIEEKFKEYPNHKLIIDECLKKFQNHPDHVERTNQTDLSAYFKNLYHAIKMVDESKYLSGNEKRDLIKIYRAQLSNPEIYVLFFNVTARFGRKWRDNKYFEKYDILKNLPKGYCDGYDPKDFYAVKFDYDEE